MSTRLFAAAAVILCCAGVAPAADPELTGLVMPGAKILAGINVEQARSTPFGQYVLTRLAQQEQGFQRLAQATGFDPRSDIREVLIASTGEPGDNGRLVGLVLVRGTFNVTQIAAAAQAKGAAAESYGGATLLGAGRGGAVALLGPTLAVAGKAEDVRAAVDRRTTPTSLDAALAVRVNQLSTTQDAWVISLVPPSVAGARLPDPTLQGVLRTDVLNSIQQTSAAVKFGPNVDVTAEAVTQNAQDATTLASILQLLAALAQSNARTDVAGLLQALNVSTSGAAVRVAVSIPESQIEGLIEQPRRVARRRR